MSTPIAAKSVTHRAQTRCVRVRIRSAHRSDEPATLVQILIPIVINSKTRAIKGRKWLLQ